MKKIIVIISFIFFLAYFNVPQTYATCVGPGGVAGGCQPDTQCNAQTQTPGYTYTWTGEESCGVVAGGPPNMAMCTCICSAKADTSCFASSCTVSDSWGACQQSGSSNTCSNNGTQSGTHTNADCSTFTENRSCDIDMCASGYTCQNGTCVTQTTSSLTISGVVYNDTNSDQKYEPNGTSSSPPEPLYTQQFQVHVFASTGQDITNAPGDGIGVSYPSAGHYTITWSNFSNVAKDGTSFWVGIAPPANTSLTVPTLKVNDYAASYANLTQTYYGYFLADSVVYPCGTYLYPQVNEINCSNKNTVANQNPAYFSMNNVNFGLKGSTLAGIYSISGNIYQDVNNSHVRCALNSATNTTICQPPYTGPQTDSNDTSIKVNNTIYPNVVNLTNGTYKIPNLAGGDYTVTYPITDQSQVTAPTSKSWQIHLGP